MDQALFLAIHNLPHTPLLTDLARFLSGIGQWGAVWLLLAGILFFREEKRDHWFFLPTIVALGLSFLLSEVLLKNIFGRSRPPGAMLSDYSFPSTHATVAWAMAFVLWREEPRLRPWLVLLAALISLSRIYLGVHYPTDIVGGVVLGLIIGYVSLVLTKRTRSGGKRKTTWPKP